MFANGFLTENYGNPHRIGPHKLPGNRVVASRPVRGRRETLRAPVLVVLAGVLAALAVPGSGGANPPVAKLRGREASLGDQTHAAVMSLYSLDTRLAQSRARVAALLSQAASVRAQLANVARDETMARHAWRASVAALESHLRAAYENGQPDGLAVLLGASSIDDAMTRLDDVQRVAKMNRETIAQTRQARSQLQALQLELQQHSQRLQSLLAAAEQTTAQLASARAERAGYIASLVRARAFTSHRIAQLQAQAKASAARAPAPIVEQASSTVPQPTTAPQTTPSNAGTSLSMTVTATGYSLGGHTATGLPVGWGVIAVDPSVIPLGTRLTIPGYGEGIASDTGGSVRGATIDLWFPSLAQAAAWGRRTVTITLH
jgi:3D (Asp-Asp-Asp) domain-containing protein